ncbi:S8 family peptidase [Monashia sp. NPDC004114]
MTTPPWFDQNVPNPDQRARYTIQLELMMSRLNNHPKNRARGITVARYPDDGAISDTEFLYARQRLLTKKEHASEVVRELSKTCQDPFFASDVIPGVLTQITLPDSLTTIEALDRLRDTPGDDKEPIAAFDRVVHIASASSCPATEPMKAESDTPVPALEDVIRDPRVVRVVVVDTGIPANPQGHLISLARWDWMDDGNVVGEAEDPDVGHYRGHGLFVAGVIASMARTAQIDVRAYLMACGGRIESDLAVDVYNAFNEKPSPDIISLSAGTSTLSGTTGSAESLFSFKALMKLFAESETLLVCAAGNDQSEGPFEPASLKDFTDYPIAVGALDANGKRAGYSNFGDWVDVYARGSDMVNAFPNGAYHYEEPPRVGKPDLQVTNWMATWSGTSFSTPLVTGIIARRMVAKSQTAKQAWRDLKRIASSKVIQPGDLPTLEPDDAIKP